MITGDFRCASSDFRGTLNSYKLLFKIKYLLISPHRREQIKKLGPRLSGGERGAQGLREGAKQVPLWDWRKGI